MSPQNTTNSAEETNKTLDYPEFSLSWGQNLAHPAPGDEVCITGISGKYPDSDSILHFQENLLNKVDMVTGDTRRWYPTHPEVPQRSGKINDITSFDAGYFGVHARQAITMDPMMRIFLETAIECIMDAGMNPAELEGSKCGVFLGACFSESEKTWFFDNLESQNFCMTGLQRSMIANRLSYFLKLNGPSFTADTACSSSLYAFDNAYRAIRNGECDYAIVGGSNMVLHPFVSLQFARLGVLSMDGACKAFDANGNGYARSEAIGAVFLQKSKDAKRIYAQVVHSKTNCDGYKSQGITYPSGEAQVKLLQDFYEECQVDPAGLSFLEAHGTGTKVGDPEELQAIDEVFTKNRNKPLWIGSVKSNIGHSEPSSGICSISKVIIGFESGYFPPNLHYSKPREGVEGLEKGRLKVVTEPMAFDKNDDAALVGINSFGFGGGNCHILLKRHSKVKINDGIPKDDLPRLVCVSGRTKEAIDSMCEDIKKTNLDAEYIRLFHEIFKTNIIPHVYRGYSIFTKNGEVQRSFKYSPLINQKLYIAFSGFNNAWQEFGKQLFKFPIFAGSIQKIHDILLTKNESVAEIILNNTHNKSRVHAVLGNLAVQIAMVDILKSLNIKADGIFGSGLGEIVCAYYDDSLTLNEAVLISFYLAKALKDISEPYELDKNLVKIEPALVKLLKSIIVKPKSRSKIWLSKSRHNLASPEYFVEALVKQLKVENLSTKICEKSVIFEIGSGQLSKQLDNVLHDFKQVATIFFDENENENKCICFLKTLGRLYENGIALQLDVLYPKVAFPVSRSTPMLSPHIKWKHDKEWFVTDYRNTANLKVGERSVYVTLKDEDWQFLSGHVIDGRNLFPASGYLNLVWETLALVKGSMTNDMYVTFENVKFLRATNLPKEKEAKIELTCMIQRGSGNFEVIEGGQCVVSGKVYASNDGRELLKVPIPVGLDTDIHLPLTSKDIYKDLRLRGYNYKGEFRAIEECDNSAEVGLIKWTSNWITFIDNVFQMKILNTDSRLLYVPTAIDKLVIDAKKHIAYALELGDDQKFRAYIQKETGIIKCGAVEVRGLMASCIPRKKPLGDPVLEKYEFIPNETILDIHQSLRVNMQLALENMQGTKIKAIELIDDCTREDAEPLGPVVLEVLGDQPLIQTNMLILSKKPLELKNIIVEDRQLATESDCSLVIGSDILSRNQMLQQSLGVLKDNGFILSREAKDFDISTANTEGINLFSVHTTSTEKLIFFRKESEFSSPVPVNVSTINDEFKWIPKVQDLLKNNDNIILYAQDEPLNGILGFTNCLKREPNGHTVRCFFILDKTAPPFDLSDDFYSRQLKKNMSINVYKNGKWGTYRHLKLENLNEIETEHAYCNVTVRGDLSSLKYLEGPLSSKSDLPPGYSLISIYYSALNFRDVMTASGRISADVITLDRTIQDCIMGFEFSGKTQQGRRICGMITSKALASLTLADNLFVYDVPDSWSLEEAATVPVVYGTVLYALVIRANMRRGNTILIHSGSGGIGQAALCLALYYGCKVFTTVGSTEKRELLKKIFPQLKDHQIGNSRDTSFEELIKQQTNGRGVDIVLNSLAEEKLLATVRCLAKGGKFIEIGKFDLANNNPLQLLLLEKEASFHGVMLDQLFISNNKYGKEVTDLLNSAIQNGAVVPLQRTIFKENEVEKAFRFMASGKHTGKVLIKIRNDDQNKSTPPVPKMYKAMPRYHCDTEKVYIICGGLGGFGLELADWLVLRGARKLVLTSRTGVQTGYQDMRIRIWKTYGSIIKISTADITTKQGCEQLINESNELGSVEAIFNLAVVLKDALFENQSEESYKISFGPKAKATKYLDEVTRKLCPNLRDFVIFSSVSCGRGNAGQTNYGMANSVMERICEQRKSDGLPALAIEWGAIGEVGLVAEMQEEHIEIEIGGTLQQRISNCLQVMDGFLKQKSAIVSSIVVAEKRGGIDGADNIADVVANILGLKDLKTVSLHATLAELGMDSMTAVEIKQTLEREFEVFLTAQDIRSMTFARLQEIQSEKEAELAGGVKKGQVPTGLEMLFRIMGDEENLNVPVIESESNVEDKSKSETLIILSGIEGNAQTVSPIVKQLNCQTISAQFCYANPENTIQEMAQNVLSNVQKYISKSKPFKIAAYSFGGVIAMEVVALLESKGYRGTLMLIESSLHMMKELLNTFISTNSSEDAFQVSVLNAILATYCPQSIILNHQEKLFKCGSYDDKILYCQEIVPKDTPYTKEHQKSIAVGIYKRLKALQKYSPSFTKLKSKVKLYKASHSSLPNLTPDHNLSEVCELPVEVVEVNGNHFSILENVDLAKQINQEVQTSNPELFVKESMIKEKIITDRVAEKEV